MLNTSLTPRLSLCLFFSWYSLSLVQVMWTRLAVAPAVFSLVRWEAVFLSWMSWACTEGKQLEMQFCRILLFVWKHDTTQHDACLTMSFRRSSTGLFGTVFVILCPKCKWLKFKFGSLDSRFMVKHRHTKKSLTSNDDEMLGKAARRWQWRQCRRWWCW